MKKLLSTVLPLVQMLWPSVVRTTVPFIAGLILTYAPEWLGITEESAGKVAMLALGMVYYILVRVLESFAPMAGLLLGKSGAPTYLPEIDDDEPLS